jgi:hypothetical protein
MFGGKRLEGEKGRKLKKLKAESLKQKAES